MKSNYSNETRYLNLEYKGPRDYAHGSDIFNVVNRELKAIADPKGWIKSIVFRKFATNDCYLQLSPESKPPPEKLAATLIVQLSDSTLEAVVVESERPITRHYEFDEEKILSICLIDQSSIKQKQRSGFSEIEEVIAMTKGLHSKLFPLQSGKWVFSELHLLQDFSSNSLSYCVELKQSLGGRMTVSEIIEDGVKIGQIKFIVAHI